LLNVGTLAATTHGDIYISAAAGVLGFSSLSVSSVPNLFVNGGFVNGINANGGNIQIIAPTLDVFGPARSSATI